MWCTSNRRQAGETGIPWYRNPGVWTRMLKRFMITVLILMIFIPANAIAAGYRQQCGGRGMNFGSDRQALTADEQDWLIFMREEEKLARDTYMYLYAKWRSPLFRTIACSEQHHVAVLNTRLDRYGIPDPNMNTPGRFTNATLQDLYNNVTVQGSISWTEALRVGIIIEEKDISDLTDAIAATEQSDVKTLYGNLRAVSYNHLAAFGNTIAWY